MFFDLHDWITRWLSPSEMRQGDSRYTRSGLAGGELPPTNKLSDRASKEVKIDIHNRQPYE
ncbi:MAG: hypothetical protein RIE73_17815, partial [Coleofasciculus sp. C1-SOL-03]|uniref:hypothetical protein n=1 Tax=Coleofasciculus sp. C1-SOL-03 TaxID=3069522 RepID=UPI0032FB24FA